MPEVYQPDEGGLMNIESGSSDNNRDRMKFIPAFQI